MEAESFVSKFSYLPSSLRRKGRDRDTISSRGEEGEVQGKKFSTGRAETVSLQIYSVINFCQRSSKLCLCVIGDLAKRVSLVTGRQHTYHEREKRENILY